METSLFESFALGALAFGDHTLSFSSLPWNPHPQFTGVALKNLVTAEHTGGKFTCHLVQIDPNCSIGRHAHPNSIELHEVVEGDGVCRTEQGELVYTPGRMAVLAANAPHEVRAGPRGLKLFAKFINV